MHLELRASLARKDLMQDVALGLNPEVSGEVACVWGSGELCRQSLARAEPAHSLEPGVSPGSTEGRGGSHRR